MLNHPPDHARTTFASLAYCWHLHGSELRALKSTCYADVLVHALTSIHLIYVAWLRSQVQVACWAVLDFIQTTRCDLLIRYCLLCLQRQCHTRDCEQRPQENPIPRC
jgi:hypothetical protein